MSIFLLLLQGLGFLICIYVVYRLLPKPGANQGMIDIKAKVIDIQANRLVDNKTVYFPVIAYKVSGKVYKNVGMIGSKSQSQYQKNQLISIRVNPNDPAEIKQNSILFDYLVPAVLVIGLIGSLYGSFFVLTHQN